MVRPGAAGDATRCPRARGDCRPSGRGPHARRAGAPAKGAEFVPRRPTGWAAGGAHADRARDSSGPDRDGGRLRRGGARCAGRGEFAEGWCRARVGAWRRGRAAGRRPDEPRTQTFVRCFADAPRWDARPSMPAPRGPLHGIRRGVCRGAALPSGSGPGARPPPPARRRCRHATALVPCSSRSRPSGGRRSSHRRGRIRRPSWRPTHLPPTTAPRRSPRGRSSRDVRGGGGRTWEHRGAERRSQSLPIPNSTAQPAGWKMGKFGNAFLSLPLRRSHRRCSQEIRFDGGATLRAAHREESAKAGSLLRPILMLGSWTGIAGRAGVARCGVPKDRGRR